MTHALITRLALLDGVALHRENEVLVTDLPPGVQRLVALVGLTGRPGRSAVAGQLWPEVTEEQAQHNLRSALWRLQKAAPGLVEAVSGALALNPEVEVDVRQLTDWARRVLAPGAPFADCLTAHPGLYGELLPGWYDDWVLLERERLRQLRMHAWEALSQKLVEAERYGEAVEAAHEAIRAGALRESAHRALIRAHAAEGNIGEALLAYERFADRLADELGLAPSVQLEALLHQLMRSRLAGHRGGAEVTTQP